MQSQNQDSQKENFLMRIKIIEYEGKCGPVINKLSEYLYIIII